MEWILSGCSNLHPPGIATPQNSQAEPLSVAVWAPACPLDRYYFDDLAMKVEPFVSEMDGPSIAYFLATEVNGSVHDKVAPNISGGFTPENSISGFEAFEYSLRLFVNGVLDDGSSQSQIGHGLMSVFLGADDHFRIVPPPHYIVFKSCHDGDTCNVVEMQNSNCAFAAVQTAVRVSGIDAPEVGYYPTGQGAGWVNTKLVENVDKLRLEWLGNVQLPESVMKDVNRLIAVNVDYTGRLAGLIRNDLNTWNGSEGVPRQIEESVVNWVWEGKGDKTPPILCGTWQPFDKYGRRLGSFSQLYPSYLESYLRGRLAALMSDEGRQRYEQYVKKITSIIKRLKNSQNDKVRQLVARFENDPPDPEIVFSQPQCARMADAFHQFAADNGAHYALDDQVLQIIIGSVYAYEKYRNQDGDVYQAANDIARQNGFGFWGEETFKTLYMINEHDPRYHPPHCPAP